MKRARLDVRNTSQATGRYSLVAGSDVPICLGVFSSGISLQWWVTVFIPKTYAFTGCAVSIAH